MRRFGVVIVAIALALACAACGGGKDSVAQTCRKINGLPHGVESTADSWAPIEAIRRSASPSLAALLDEIIRAGKAKDFGKAVMPMSKLQVECAFAGESLA